MIQADGSTYRDFTPGFYAMDTFGKVTFVWKRPAKGDKAKSVEVAVLLANNEAYINFDVTTDAQRKKLAREFGGDAVKLGNAEFRWTQMMNQMQWDEFLQRFQPAPRTLRPLPPTAPESERAGKHELDPTRLQPTREGRDTQDYKERTVNKTNGVG